MHATKKIVKLPWPMAWVKKMGGNKDHDLLRKSRQTNKTVANKKIAETWIEGEGLEAWRVLAYLIVAFPGLVFSGMSLHVFACFCLTPNVGSWV